MAKDNKVIIYVIIAVVVILLIFIIMKNLSKNTNDDQKETDSIKNINEIGGEIESFGSTIELLDDEIDITV